MASLSDGAFSSRDSVGCEQRSAPESGNRPQASLNAGSVRQIVGVLITAGDGVDAGSDHVGAGMADAAGIAMVEKASHQSVGDAETLLGHRQQHDAAIGCEAAAIKSSCDFLAANGWKRKQQEIIIGHGGRGRRETRERVV
jgi:hypothetical protein